MISLEAKFIRAALFYCVALNPLSAKAGAIFDFEYRAQDGSWMVNGSFEGSRSGEYVTDISNLSLFVNGVDQSVLSLGWYDVSGDLLFQRGEFPGQLLASRGYEREQAPVISFDSYKNAFLMGFGAYDEIYEQFVLGNYFIFGPFDIERPYAPRLTAQYFQRQSQNVWSGPGEIYSEESSQWELTMRSTEVPLPSTLALFVAGLLGLFWIDRASRKIS